MIFFSCNLKVVFVFIIVHQQTNCDGEVEAGLNESKSILSYFEVVLGHCSRKNHASLRSSLFSVDQSAALNSEEWPRFLRNSDSSYSITTQEQCISSQICHLLSLFWKRYPGLDGSPVLSWVVKSWHLSIWPAVCWYCYLDSPLAADTEGPHSCRASVWLI